MTRRGWIESTFILLDKIRGNNINLTKTQILREMGMSPNRYYYLLDHLVVCDLVKLFKRGKREEIPKITKRGDKWLISMEKRLGEIDFEHLKSRSPR